jgi:hypothetical protein
MPDARCECQAQTLLADHLMSGIFASAWKSFKFIAVPAYY